MNRTNYNSDFKNLSFELNVIHDTFEKVNNYIKSFKDRVDSIQNEENKIIKKNGAKLSNRISLQKQESKKLIRDESIESLEEKDTNINIKRSSLDFDIDNLFSFSVKQLDKEYIQYQNLKQLKSKQSFEQNHFNLAKNYDQISNFNDSKRNVQSFQNTNNNQEYYKQNHQIIIYPKANQNQVYCSITKFNIDNIDFTPFKSNINTTNNYQYFFYNNKFQNQNQSQIYFHNKQENDNKMILNNNNDESNGSSPINNNIMNLFRRESILKKIQKNVMSKIESKGMNIAQNIIVEADSEEEEEDNLNSIKPYLPASKRTSTITNQGDGPQYANKINQISFNQNFNNNNYLSKNLFSKVFSKGIKSNLLKSNLDNKNFFYHKEQTKIKQDVKDYVRSQLIFKLDIKDNVLKKLNTVSVKNNENTEEVDKIVDFQKNEEHFNRTLTENDNKRIDFKISSHIIKTINMNDTELKKLIQELEKFPQCLVMIDENLEIVQQNQHICDTLLYNKNELIHQNFSQMIASDNPLEVQQFIKELISKMKDENLNSEQIGEFTWSMIDKSLEIQSFKCRVNNHTIYKRDGGSQSQYYIFYMNEEEKIGGNFSFDPNSNFQQVGWSIIIGISLIYLFLQIPYDLSFGGEAQMDDYNFASDMVITLIQTIDIFLNFFARFDDPKTGKPVYSNIDIAFNQMRGQLLLDIVSTVPFDLLFNFVAFNTNIIKSIRIIKIFKFIKLFRIVKYLSFVSSKNKIIESLQKDQGKEFFIAIKRTSGLSELMLINFQILIAAHYQTVIQYYFKNDLIENDNSTWLQDQFSITTDMTKFNIYVFLTSFQVQTALGLGVLVPLNTFEIILNTCWMFIGLSMFGQGIGNISSQLNNAIQDEVEYLNSISFFEKLCEKNGIDQRIQKEILAEVEEFQDNEDEMNFYKKGQILSRSTMIKLENALQKEFVEKFTLLSALKIPIIRQIKTCARSLSNKKLIQGSEINEILFITSGSMIIYDERMNLVNEQSENEIFGMSQFKHQLELKQKINIEDLQDQQKQNSLEQQKTKNAERQNLNLETLKKKILDTQQNNNEGNELLSRTQLQDDDKVKFQLNLTPVFSEDVEQFKLPFKNIHEIMCIDLESFFTIYKQNLNQFEPISTTEKLKSAQNIVKFNSHESFGILIKTNGEIYDLNEAASHHNVLQKLIGLNLLNIIVKPDVKSIDQLSENIIVKLNLDDQIIILSILETSTFMLSKNDNEISEITETTANFQCLRKSLIKIKIIQFEVVIKN